MSEQKPTSSPIDPGVQTSIECFDRFSKSFETSARRWELIVYPSLFAFIVLAAYGFFLIYHLTSDVAILARNVSKMSSSVELMVLSMNNISGNMDNMTKNMNIMTGRMEAMSNDMDYMAVKMDNLVAMQQSMQSMEQSTRAISLYTDHMRHSMSSMNRNIGQTTGPMQMMNSFVPFW